MQQYDVYWTNYKNINDTLIAIIADSATAWMYIK